MISQKTRARILSGLEGDLGRAKDGLLRLQSAFQGCDLKALHDESGRTREEILAEYQEDTDWATKALEDFKKHSELFLEALSGEKKGYKKALEVAEVLRQSLLVRSGEVITEDLARERSNNGAQAIMEFIIP